MLNNIKKLLAGTSKECYLCSATTKNMFNLSVDSLLNTYLYHIGGGRLGHS